jgi:hypothetical protein
VISDRYGYFNNGYHFWPYLIRAGKAFGLDPKDPVYKKRSRTGGLCPKCSVHSADDRYFPCDVFQARAEAIEEAGHPATHCSRCADAMPVREGQVVPKCWFCEDAPRRSQHTIKGSVAYVDDGHGCIDKVPAWTVEGRTS